MRSALLVKEPWASLIISGVKTLEIRSMRTGKIGKEIYIAKAGSKTLIGKVIIDKCVELSANQFNSLSHLHHAADYKTKKKIWGWYLRDAVRFEEPIPYEHPQGAQIWVKIPD